MNPQYTVVYDSVGDKGAEFSCWFAAVSQSQWSYLIASVADLVISLQIWLTSSRRCSSLCHTTEGSESLFILCGIRQGPINIREKLFII